MTDGPIGTSPLGGTFVGVEARVSVGTLSSSAPPPTAEINVSALADVPSEQDEIGFYPYVRAIAWFLSSGKTKPPLTVSIEGAWGSGKSSFMLQLENEIKSQSTPGDNQHYIRFNAWRSDKDEALWAAFALTLIKQLSPKIPFLKRIVANVGLLWNRLDWKRGWLELAHLALSVTVIAGLTIYALIDPNIISQSGAGSIAIGGSFLAAAYFAYEKAKKVLGNPLSYDLSKYVRNLKYEEKVSFIDRFQDDFAAIIKNYIGPRGRVFVFIDDLDRCEIPRAAELLQAINLLLSADQSNLFFILGLDREMVAAGIAAKNEKLIPYLAASRSPQGDGKDIYRSGIEYGFTFMEKFVQVPFRIPNPDEREIAKWVSELTGIPTDNRIMPAATASRTDAIDMHDGSDPVDFESVVEKMAQVFGFNPRRLKQFINVFRLRVLIALSTGVLSPAPQNAQGSSSSSGITIHQLGLFTALLMRWPQLSGDLAERPSLFLELRNSDYTSAIVARWRNNSELLAAIEIDDKYSLMGLNLKPVLMIMPNAYSRALGVQNSSTGRTRLVAGRGVQNEANTTSPSTERAFAATVPSFGYEGTGSISSVSPPASA